MKLRALRQQRAISQSDLARAVHCSRGYISQLENGSKAPSIELTTRLAEVLGVDASDLLEESDLHLGGGKIVRVERVNFPDDNPTPPDTEVQEETAIPAGHSLEFRNVPSTVSLGIVWGLLEDARLRAIYGLPDLGDFDVSITPPSEDPLGDTYARCSVTNHAIELTLTATEQGRVDWLVSTFSYPPAVSYMNTLVWFTTRASLADQLQYLLHLRAHNMQSTVLDSNLRAEWQSVQSLLDL